MDISALFWLFAVESISTRSERMHSLALAWFCVLLWILSAVYRATRG